MSKRDQRHTHNWKKRMTDWLIMPHAGVRPQQGPISLEELAAHGTARDCWIAVHGEVFDVTEFLPFHPGGRLIIERCAGRDCSAEYDANHTGFTVAEALPKHRVGWLEGATPADPCEPAAPTPPGGAEETESFDEVFRVLDVDGAGCITPAQFTQFVRSMGATEAEAEAMAQRALSKGSGSITSSVFAAMF